MKYFIAVFLGIFLAQNPAFAAKAESEHPPLSESTKKAIALVKRNPSEANKQNLLDSLNKSYDAVIAQKKEKLATCEKAGIKTQFRANLTRCMTQCYKRNNRS